MESDDDEPMITIGEIGKYFQGNRVDNIGNMGKKAELDLHAIPLIQNTPIYEKDLNSFEKFPWREKNTDLSQYFNFGFNEGVFLKFVFKPLTNSLHL